MTALARPSWEKIHIFVNVEHQAGRLGLVIGLVFGIKVINNKLKDQMTKF